MEIFRMLLRLAQRTGDSLYGVVCLAGCLMTGEKAKKVAETEIIQIWKPEQTTNTDKQ